jgi:hypothetical protein
MTSTPAIAQEGRRPHGDGQHAAQGARRSEGAPRAEGRAAPRAQAVPRNDVRRNDRPVVVAPRVVRPTIVAPRVVRPNVVRPYVARPYYSRPYVVRPYVFRPRFRVSVGLFAGYPVPYAYAYPYPVPVYGYAAPSAPVVVGPNSLTYGGVSLEITPGDASVYVDGQYAGLVQDFDGTRQTLTVVNGRHHIEINAPGYEPLAFDVDVYPGQIVPLRGDLQPY